MLNDRQRRTDRLDIANCTNITFPPSLQRLLLQVDRVELDLEWVQELPGLQHQLEVLGCQPWVVLPHLLLQPPPECLEGQ